MKRNWNHCNAWIAWWIQLWFPTWHWSIAWLAPCWWTWFCLSWPCLALCLSWLSCLWSHRLSCFWLGKRTVRIALWMLLTGIWVVKAMWPPQQGIMWNDILKVMKDSYNMLYHAIPCIIILLHHIILPLCHPAFSFALEISWAILSKFDQIWEALRQNEKLWKTLKD
jgi:hypothetical protein